MTALGILLTAAVLASWSYWALAVVAVRRLVRAPSPAPAAMPGVTILKPVRGVDAGASESFATFCRQDYPAFEVVFGVADPHDPAVAVIERLRAEHPGAQIRLVVAPARGPNRKASLLDAMAREARHGVLVAADADIRVGPDYLRRIVASLLRPGVGLVTCPYLGEDARTVAARLEALYMGVTFLPSVALASGLLGVPLAMGSTIGMRAADVSRIGGFGAVADYLADDYQVGARTAALGLRVVVTPVVVRSVLGATVFRDQWDRELRWSRCARVSQPGGHLGYAVTFSTALALALAAVTFPGWLGAFALAGSLAVRWAAATAIARATGDRASLTALSLLPVRDLLTTAIWAAGLFGRRIVWRGEVFDVSRDGRLLRRAGQDGSAAAKPAIDRTS
jgi:ceramide glucosyltransferase